MTTAPIRVMVVDDSAVMRGLWTRVIENELDMRVVAAAGDGKAALHILGSRRVDVVLLDIEMPEMNGIEALPGILASDPDVQVIMASVLTLKCAEITFKALSLGAADFVTKPLASRSTNALEAAGRELVAKIRAIAHGRRHDRDSRVQPASQRMGARLAHATQGTARVVGITSSTGGPNALTAVLSALPRDFRPPILIVQHMPAVFTTMLADRLRHTGARPCAEAEHGMPVEEGHSYVAPGGRHMVLRVRGGREHIELTGDPPENSCRPSADALFRTMAQVYGSGTLAVVLTGMGRDGLAGARAVSEAGGHVVVQDKATSVVWGMPAAVAVAGLADQILPLHSIGPFIDGRARTVR